MPALIAHLIFAGAGPILLLVVAGADGFSFTDLFEGGWLTSEIGQLFLYGAAAVGAGGAVYGGNRLLRRDMSRHRSFSIRSAYLLNMRPAQPPSTEHAEDKESAPETLSPAMFGVKYERRMPLDKMRIVSVCASKDFELIRTLSLDDEEELTTRELDVTPSVRVDAFGEGFNVNLRGEAERLIPDKAKKTVWVFEVTATEPGKQLLTVHVQLVRKLADGGMRVSEVESYDIEINVYVGWYGAVVDFIISNRAKIVFTIFLMLLAALAAMLGYEREFCALFPSLPIFCPSAG